MDILYYFKEIINNSGFFDETFYICSNQDIKNVNIDPVIHYLIYGWKEGRNPSLKFNTKSYLDSYSDVKESGINPLLHYILYGRDEGRNAFGIKIDHSFLEIICNDFPLLKDRTLYYGKDRIIIDNVFGCVSGVSLPIIKEGGVACATKTWMRIRAVAYALTKGLNLKPILSLNKVNKTIKGVSLSDTSSCSLILDQLFDHQNTFLDKNPFLDIMNPPATINNLDFIISSDVFEHVTPPIEIAFKNSFNILKNGGILILTVPYIKEDKETIEHFPNLFNWRLNNKEDDRGQKYFYIENITKDGNKEIFKNIIFHEGEGQVIEMRLFTLKSILKIAEDVGFVVRIIDENVPLFGIDNNGVDSAPPLILKKPE